MAEKQPHVSNSKTLFVRNLPYNITNETLESIFSEFGPTKRAFVVKDKGQEKCKGFGYVTFSVTEDAAQAQKNLKKIEGRNIQVLFAEKKKKVKKSKQDLATESNEDEDEHEEKVADSILLEKPVFHQPSQHDQYKTVIVAWRPTGAQTDILAFLNELDVKNVARVFPQASQVPNSEVTHVCFKSVRDAKRGCRKLNKKDLKDNPLKASLLGEVPQKVKVTTPHKKTTLSQTISTSAQKETSTSTNQGRIIIRNLSFQCRDSDVHGAFEKFGSISEVLLTKKPGGKPSGFGFVEFANVSDANKAIIGMNGKHILARPIAVDWAIPKNKYEAAKIKTSELVETDVPEIIKTEETKLDKTDEDISDSSEQESELSDDEENFSSEKNISEADSGNESDEDTDDGDDDDDDDDDDHLSDSIESDDNDDEKSKLKIKKKKNLQLPSRKSDVGEGRTLFIRNVPFTVLEEELQELLEEFGVITYCRLVFDRNTEHPKGTAFVQFKTKDAAEKCLEKSKAEDKDAGIVARGRKLLMDVAVSREKVKDFNVKKEHENKDKRNLFLAREGSIRPGTEAAKDLSKSDLDKRMKVETLKRQKLKNLNIFISTTRLCIRNLPINLDDKELKKVLLKAVDEKKAKITECRIMRDYARPNAQGVGKSRGYGFVTFTEHQHALKALQKTNNNSNIFGKDRCPIVEFSLENKIALQSKEKKIERQKLRQVNRSNTGVDKGGEQKKQPKKLKGATVVKLSMLSEEDRAKKSKGKYGPKGLPTHWGAKVRHKPRPLQGPQKNKKGKGNSQSKAYQKEPKMKIAKKRKPNTMSDDFDKLVHSYKKKLMSVSMEPPTKKAKWFNS